MIETFEEKIKCGSDLYKDGHKPYPKVSENLGLSHFVVNHSKGFVAPDYPYNNNQERFWSHSKASMRKEQRVKEKTSHGGS